MSLPSVRPLAELSIVNFHAALLLSHMQARIVLCLRDSRSCSRYVYVPLRSALNACRRHAFSLLPTAVYAPLRSFAGQAPLALSNPSYLGVIKCAYAGAK